jgi:hypothetical protein
LLEHPDGANAARTHTDPNPDAAASSAHAAMGRRGERLQRDYPAQSVARPGAGDLPD